MSKLVEHISKKAVPEHQKNVIFEVTAEDQTEEDVEVPYVMVKLRKGAWGICHISFPETFWTWLKTLLDSLEVCASQNINLPR